MCTLPCSPIHFSSPGTPLVRRYGLLCSLLCPHLQLFSRNRTENGMLNEQPYKIPQNRENLKNILQNPTYYPKVLHSYLKMLSSECHAFFFYQNLAKPPEILHISSRSPHFFRKLPPKVLHISWKCCILAEISAFS